MLCASDGRGDMNMTLRMELGEFSYDIIIERGCSARAGEYLELDRRVLIVTDDGVPTEYSERIAAVCREPIILTVPQGEGSKSLSRFEEILTVMLGHGFTRRDCVVAVGGGVVGDLAGFAASAYMRGVDFYNIPTTTLSQIDSSIGGKTAVNLGGIKNIVGAFYQPRRVLVDPDVTSTLSQRQFAAGLAEAVKMSATSDAELFSIFENGGIEAELDTIITRSLLIKKRVVEADEREGGLRRVLNFGHTIGHGIESEEELNGLYHGECVALGMLPMCSPEVRARLIPVLGRLGLPTEYEFDTDKIISAACHDKKSGDGGVTVVIVDTVGGFRFERMTFDCLRERLEAFLREANA